MKLESKFKKFPGTVEIPNFLTTTQLRTFENGFFGDKVPSPDEDERVFISISREKLEPFIIEFVQVWNLEGIPKEPQPGDIPYRVTNWLALEIYKLWLEEMENPNA